jgi:hypothetical protein
MAVVVSEIRGLIDTTKSQLKPTFGSSYNLQSFANAIYGKLSTSNGFSSLDVAGMLLDNGRIMGVGFEHGPTLPLMTP